MRTLLDIYVVNKIEDVGTFKQKLIKLSEEVFIAKTKIKSLEAAIDSGNAAAHRGFKPETKILFQVLDIIENLLQSELVDRNVEEIKNITPKRK